MGLGAFYERPDASDKNCPRCGRDLYPARCGICGEAKVYFCSDWQCDNLPEGECKCVPCEVCGADADEHEALYCKVRVDRA